MRSRLRILNYLRCWSQLCQRLPESRFTKFPSLAPALTRCVNAHKYSHERAFKVAYPPGIPFKKLEVIPEPKVLTFPFTLDPFQIQALLCIDNNQSVMVSAHTSAGKTVIAECVFF